MISYRHIASVTYYLDSSRKPDAQMGYYADAMGEPPGRWWSPANWQAEDGAVVDPLALERLASYRDTQTGRTLPGQRAADARVATDYSFSTPKAVSALWAVSDEEGRAKIEALVEDTVRSTLEGIHERGLIEARRGKGGKQREAVAAPVAAIFMHRTTREGDPQLHAHVVMMNVAMRADGTVGAVNNEKLLDVRKALDAVYTNGLARRLEGLGVKVEPSPEHGFKIVGQPDDLIDLWSKRRQQIVAAAAERGIETKDDARQAQTIALQTRQKKADVMSLDQLEERWLSEKWGHDRDLMIEMTQDSMPREKFDPEWHRLDREPVERTAEQEIAGQVRAMTTALKEMSEGRSWWRRDQLAEMVIRHGTGITSSAGEGRMIDMMIERGDLIQVERDGKRLMTSKAILEAEKAIVGITKERRSEKAFFSMKAYEAAMADSRLSDEQEAALQAMLIGGGIVATQGGAGVGKTTASAGIKRACEADNKRLILASPEWRAAGVLAKELENQEKYSALRRLKWNGRRRAWR
jgi:conjugative relaxase-like TrwC/TraI family protein